MRLGTCAICLLVCCTSAASARTLQQISDPANPALSTLAPAPVPALAPSASAAASPAPVGTAPPCGVPYSANIKQTNSGGSSQSSFTGDVCVIVYPGVSEAQCSQLGQAKGQTFLPSSDGACLWPDVASCSTVASATPDLTQCPSATVNAVQEIGRQGLLDSAITTNSAVSTRQQINSALSNMNFPNIANSAFGNLG